MSMIRILVQLQPTFAHQRVGVCVFQLDSGTRMIQMGVKNLTHSDKCQKRDECVLVRLPCLLNQSQKFVCE